MNAFVTKPVASYAASVISIANNEATIEVEIAYKKSRKEHVINKGFTVGMQGRAFFYPAARMYAWVFVPLDAE